MKKPTYNSKNFLAPDSPRSMACFHAKVMDDGIMKLTIHDCKGSIQLHNDLNNPEEINEAMSKLSALASGIIELQDFIYQHYKHGQNNPIREKEWTSSKERVCNF